MHKCNYALCLATPRFDHLVGNCNANRRWKERGENVLLTKGDAICLLLLVLILIALFAAKRLQLNAICGGHFVVPFRHVATAEAAT